MWIEAGASQFYRFQRETIKFWKTECQVELYLFQRVSIVLCNIGGYLVEFHCRSIVLESPYDKFNHRFHR